MLEAEADQGISPKVAALTGKPTGAYRPSCGGCIAKEIGVCAGFTGGRTGGQQAATAGGVPSSGQLYPARRPIIHHREVSESVPVICTGWALTALHTQSGKRQIVSFSLGGDAASASYIFEAAGGRTVEAISEVYCRKFRRKEFQAALLAHERGKAALANLVAKDRESSDQLHLDLNRRSAESRIARLILNLSARIQAKGLGQSDNFEFPLRQQHIGDMTGLTTVHVCKILSRMRTAGVVGIEGRRMRILDRKGLQELADQ